MLDELGAIDLQAANAAFKRRATLPVSLFHNFKSSAGRAVVKVLDARETIPDKCQGSGTIKERAASLGEITCPRGTTESAKHEFAREQGRRSR